MPLRNYMRSQVRSIVLRHGPLAGHSLTAIRTRLQAQSLKYLSFSHFSTIPGPRI